MVTTPFVTGSVRVTGGGCPTGPEELGICVMLTWTEVGEKGYLTLTDTFAGLGTGSMAMSALDCAEQSEGLAAGVQVSCLPTSSCISCAASFLIANAVRA